MAKKQSFADKASKKKTVNYCPVCKEAISYTLVVSPEPTADGKSYKMRSRNIGICKCNEKSVLA